MVASIAHGLIQYVKGPGARAKGRWTWMPSDSVASSLFVFGGDSEDRAGTLLLHRVLLRMFPAPIGFTGLEPSIFESWEFSSSRVGSGLQHWKAVFLLVLL